MEEKKIESERNKDESQQNKKWIESLGFENLAVEEWRTHEERTKNGEERRKIFMKLLTETTRKRYGSNSAWISFIENTFSPKTAEMHSWGG